MDSFESVLVKEGARAWRLASRLSACAADADDILQEAYIVAWQKRTTLRSEPWPWFCVVIAHCAKNYNRKHRRMAFMDSLDGQPDTPQTRSHDIESRETRDYLVEALSALPDPEREAVTLCIMGELTHEQASEVTGLPLGTIKTRVRKGMERLRAKFSNHERWSEALFVFPPLLLAPSELEAKVAAWVQVARDRSQVPAHKAALKSGLRVTGGAAVMLGLLLIAVVALPATRITNDTQQTPALTSDLKPEDGSARTTAMSEARDQGEVATLTAGEPSSVEVPASAKATTFAFAKPQVDPAQAELYVGYWPSKRVRTHAWYARTPAGPEPHGWVRLYYDLPHSPLSSEGWSGTLGRHGLWRLYYPPMPGIDPGSGLAENIRGPLEAVGAYQDGNPIGGWVWYRPGGFRLKSGTYDQNGQEVGWWEFFYPDTPDEVVERASVFVDGERNGMCWWFPREGDGAVSCNYVAGNKDGWELEHFGFPRLPRRVARWEHGQLVETPMD